MKNSGNELKNLLKTKEVTFCSAQKRTQNELVFACKKERNDAKNDRTARERRGWHRKRKVPTLNSNKCFKQLFEKRVRAIGIRLVAFPEGTKPECL